MSDYEVPEPILNSPYDEPAEHWNIEEGASPERRPGRRPAGYFYRNPKAPPGDDEHTARGAWQELKLVNLVRASVKQWRSQGYPGVTRTTLDLLNYWRREGPNHRLFFAQLEAAEAIIFLNEARADFRQGVEVPLDEPSDGGKEKGFESVQPLCLQDGDRRWQDHRHGHARGMEHPEQGQRPQRRSLLRCRADRLPQRHDPKPPGRTRPEDGEASLYRTRDLVPEHLMADLTRVACS